MPERSLACRAVRDRCDLGDADTRSRPEEARTRLQTASLLWSLYLENARRDHERWLGNAELLRQICQRKLARIDAEKGTPRPSGRSKPGRHED